MALTARDIMRGIKHVTPTKISVEEEIHKTVDKIVSEKWDIHRTVKLDCKPASAEQLAEWNSWLADFKKNESNINAYAEKQNQKVNAAMNTHCSVSFNPKDIEFRAESMFPLGKSRYKSTPYYLAYEGYGKEQIEIYKKYNLNKTQENHEKLMKHIYSHGQFIKEIPTLPVENKVVKEKVYKRDKIEKLYIGTVEDALIEEEYCEDDD